MQENPLGRSDLSVSAVGLGGNNFGRRLDLAGTRSVIDAALDAGMDLGDGATELRGSRAYLRGHAPRSPIAASPEGRSRPVVEPYGRWEIRGRWPMMRHGKGTHESLE